MLMTSAIWVPNGCVVLITCIDINTTQLFSKANHHCLIPLLSVYGINLLFNFVPSEDFVEFLQRCQSGLLPGGLICVKENITKSGVDLDSEDSSVTRYWSLK